MLVGVAALLLCYSLARVEAATLLSHYPTNGPVAGGTLIDIVGDGFITTGSSRSKCSFDREDGRANVLSTFNQIHNSSFLSCILPNITFFFSSGLPPGGEFVRLSVTAGTGRFSNRLSFHVYNPSHFLITEITPNEGYTNSSNNSIIIMGRGFLNTTQITCTLNSDVVTSTPAIFNDSSTLQCLLHPMQVASKINITVSLNGQRVGAISSLPDALVFTFYSPPPLISSSRFSPSYAEIFVHFDREIEIGSEVENLSRQLPIPFPMLADLELNCSQVLDGHSHSLIGSEAVCAWMNTQQRMVIIQLSSNSQVREGTILRINEHSFRTRYVSYSRLTQGSFRVASIQGLPLNPVAVLETPPSIPVCGDFTLRGDKSLYGGSRDLDYQWRIGMELDEVGNVIPDPALEEYVPQNYTQQNRLRIPSSVFSTNHMLDSSGSGEGLAPTVPYFIQLTVRNFLGSRSTAFVHNVTRNEAPSPVLYMVGGNVRTVIASMETILEGEVMRMTNNCVVEFHTTSFSWTLLSEDGSVLELGGTRMNLSILILQPNVLQPGSRYVASLTATFENGQSSSASIRLETERRLEARLSGGVRRAVGINDLIELNGQPSVIHGDLASQLEISWNCSTIAVPELENVSPSCDNFIGSNDLILSIMANSLSPGGYHFTLSLMLTNESGNKSGKTSTLESSVTQVIIRFPYPVPSIRIFVAHSRDLHSILVHERMILEAEVFSPNEGSLTWSVEYVNGFGQLELNGNVSRTPLRYRVCSSIRSCPYYEVAPSLYTSGVISSPPQENPLTNRLSLVLQPFSLLPQNSYRFKLTMRNSLGRVGFAEVDIQTESLPSSGRLESDPPTGNVLSTIFTSRALRWTDEVGDAPLLYRFGFRYSCSCDDTRVPLGSECEEEWMTGLSENNELSYMLPHINLTLCPQLLLQISDRHGALNEFTQSFDSMLSTEPLSTERMVLEPFGNGGVISRLVTTIEAMVASRYQWREALAHLTSVLSSLNMEHEAILCSSESQLTSPNLYLTNDEITSFKLRGLRLLLDIYESSIPPSETYYQVILSLLKKITRIRCSWNSYSPRSLVHDPSNVHRLVSLLENIVSTSNNFSEVGSLSRRGFSSRDVQTILSIYQQVIAAQYGIPSNASLPRIKSNHVSESFSRLLPEFGYGLCIRQGIHERAATVNLNGFMNLKSSHILFPSNYIAGGCSPAGESCEFEAVRVDFGEELLSRYLQWSCRNSNNNETQYCSGACITSTQLYLELFWQGQAYSSLIKTPLLHLSVLNPSNGATLEIQTLPSSSQFSLIFPLIAPLSNSTNLACAIWQESSSSWNRSQCQTNVMGSSHVRCQCSKIASLLYAVLEVCPDGYYGDYCNMTCPQGLWGPECRISCDCNNRGTCSPSNGSCDCDPGWTGATCNDACLDGRYGKLCRERCRCQNGASCDHMTGACTCTPGWMGPLCNTSCSKGFYGDGCRRSCECSNVSECNFVSGSCTCQAGFTGSTCHDRCPAGFFGLGCASTCQCFMAGTRSCDHVIGLCDCNDMWTGFLCNIEITLPPTTIPVRRFEAWWVVVGIIGALLALGGMAIFLIVIVIWKKKKKQNTKVFPVLEEERKVTEKSLEEVSITSSTDTMSDNFEIARTVSLEVLVPHGKSLKDIFGASSPVSETGAAVEFKEPSEMYGKHRWQIIRVISEGYGSPGGVKDGETKRDGLESRESAMSPEMMTEANSSDKEGNGLEENEGNQQENKKPSQQEKDALNSQERQEQAEMVYRRGIYLTPDATLKDLRNQFVDSKQMEQNAPYFQFLRSDVPGDRFDIETEDDILLSQIQDSLIQKRTLYIENIDSTHVMGALCICGKFAGLECTSCNRQGYCSSQCQEQDWPSHEHFCNEISAKRERRRRRRKSKNLERKHSRRPISSLSDVSSEDVCVCGKEAEYECSNCRTQGYCSEECQKEDWSYHEYYCNRPGSNVSERKRSSHTPNREKLQTVFEEPESSLEA